tara:strand:+ start:624 stop:827 length:204 start_codon:yes stop_codon:yes gene_type:complete
MSELKNDSEKFILAQSRDTKIRWLTELLKEGNFAGWFMLTKILLKYPIHKGGIETEVIDNIFHKYNL